MTDDLIDRLRALSRHEHSDYSIGDEAADALEAAREDACVALVADIRFACGDNGNRMQPELVEFIRELAVDAERLDWLARENIPEGFVFDKSDIYDYGCDAAEENGRDEPNDADIVAGHRRMIDAAIAIDQARGKARNG